MEQLNISLFFAINHFATISPIIDRIAIVLAEGMPYLFILVLGAYWFTATAQKKLIFLRASFAVLLGMLMSYIISLGYFHSRPFIDGLGKTLTFHVPDSSFPSDHTTFMFCIAITLLLHPTTRVLGVVLSLLALIGGVARIFIGVHFPFDIAMAFLLSSLSAKIIYATRRRYDNFSYKVISISDKLTKKEVN
ncbi:undecaprenyl-diphosphatase [Vibrio sp. VB16]|uniref:undecaprenyl-diphosphatase n=1 Tax=Vibrio sp. VB16 TaxID=2785746 RepID=UPI00189D3474|nr:undecaprenyl-diphosphatase [Vibrio sp. VB16]UGA56311.1 undecaprenyl-diphosphatase [Vibrio sp. VB16]